MKKYNLANLSKEEKDKIKIKILAAAVAFKEKNKIDVLAESVEMQQNKQMRSFFRQCLSYYRKL